MYLIGTLLAFVVLIPVVKKSQRILLSEDILPLMIISLGSWVTVLGIIMIAVCKKVKNPANPAK